LSLVATLGLAFSSNELSDDLRDRVAEGVAKVHHAQFQGVELWKAYKNPFDQDFIWWPYPLLTQTNGYSL
jgi:hypothetical protein